MNYCEATQEFYNAFCVHFFCFGPATSAADAWQTYNMGGEL